jgi:hypothetical protein
LTTALLPSVLGRGDAPSTAIDRGRMSGASA